MGSKIIDVQHQQHYESQSIQPIEYLMATLSHEAFDGFLAGNIIKYTSRAGKKGTLDDCMKDLAKAVTYAQWREEYSRTGRIAQFSKGVKP